MSHFILFLTHVSVDNEELSLSYLFLIHILQCFLRVLAVFETHIPVIFQVTLVVPLHLDRLDLAEDGEHFLEQGVVRAAGQVLDEQVVEFGLTDFPNPFVLLFVFDDLQRLSFDFLLVYAFYRGIGFFLRLIQYVGVSSALSIRVRLQFARLHPTERREQVEQLLLSHLLVDVLDQQVGLLVVLEL